MRSRVDVFDSSYLGATDGDVDGDLLVTADTEGTDGVASLACWYSCQIHRSSLHLVLSESQRTVDGGLTGQLLEHLGGTGEPVTRLADGNVKNQLLDLELPHGVLCLLGCHCCGVVWS